MCGDLEVQDTVGSILQPNPGMGSAPASALASLPQWFIAIGGLIYGSGYLILTQFLNRYGLGETGTEFLRAKYLHVGIMFFTLLVIPGVPILCFCYLRKAGKSNNVALAARQFNPANFVIMVNLLVVSFIPPLFAPNDSLSNVRENIDWILLLTIGPILGILILRGFDRWLRVGEMSTTMGSKVDRIVDFFRYLLVFILLCFDIKLFIPLYRTLGVMMIGGGWHFLAFTALAYTLAWVIAVIPLASRQIVQKYSDSTAQLARTAVHACVFGGLYYLCLVSFSIWVYPYIPASRGGGDYQGTPLTTIFFRPSYSALPPGILDKSQLPELTSKPLILIEQTATSIYVVDPNDSKAKKPEDWRDIRNPRPQVIGLRREGVQSLLMSRK